MHFYCEKCKKEYPLNALQYECDCGGLFRLYKDSSNEIPHLVSIGEIETPMLETSFESIGRVFLKMEHMQPTGSFKARGAYALINQLKYMGIDKIVEDSSGNAATAIAAYAAAAGIDCEVYIPEEISSNKLHYIKSFGAHIHVKKDRTAAGRAVREAAKNTYYASHIYNPLFFEGIKSLAYEIYKQLGNKIPEYIFVPAGNGTMLLGLYYGFEEIGALPAFIAVQSEKCNPIYAAFKRKKVIQEASIATAINIAEPRRLKEILMCIKRSFGNVLTVSDAEIYEAQMDIGKKGIYVEPTAACSLAGALKFFKKGKPDNYNVILPLTGTGMLS